MHIAVYFGLYGVLLIVFFIGFKIKKWIKLGLTVYFKKKDLVFLLDNDRNLIICPVKIEGKTLVNIDESVYLVNPKNTLFLNILRKLKIKKEPTPMKKESNVEYNLDKDKLLYFGGTPLYIYKEGQPEPLDLYMEQRKSIITGEYLNNIFKKMMLATNLEWFEGLKRWMPWIIIAGLLVLLIVGYLVVYGIVPQISGGGSPLGGATKLIPT